MKVPDAHAPLQKGLAAFYKWQRESNHADAPRTSFVAAMILDREVGTRLRNALSARPSSHIVTQNRAATQQSSL
jgi:hypothetical protein